MGNDYYHDMLELTKEEQATQEITNNKQEEYNNTQQQKQKQIIEEEYNIQISNILKEKNESLQRVELLISEYMDDIEHKNLEIKHLTKENDENKLIINELEEQLIHKDNVVIYELVSKLNSCSNELIVREKELNELQNKLLLHEKQDEDDIKEKYNEQEIILNDLKIEIGNSHNKICMLQEELDKCNDELVIVKKENVDFKNKLNNAVMVEGEGEEGIINIIAKKRKCEDDDDELILNRSNSSGKEEKEIVESIEMQALNELLKKRLDNLECTISNRNSKIKKLESKLKVQKEEYISIESDLCYLSNKLDEKEDYYDHKLKNELKRVKQQMEGEKNVLKQKSIDSINEIKTQMMHMISSKYNTYEITTKEYIKINIEKLENKLYSCESNLKKYKQKSVSTQNKYDKALMQSLQEKAIQSEKDLELLQIKLNHTESKLCNAKYIASTALLKASDIANNMVLIEPSSVISSSTSSSNAVGVTTTTTGNYEEEYDNKICSNINYNNDTINEIQKLNIQRSMLELSMNKTDPKASITSFKINKRKPSSRKKRSSSNKKNDDNSKEENTFLSSLTNAIDDDNNNDSSTSWLWNSSSASSTKSSKKKDSSGSGGFDRYFIPSLSNSLSNNDSKSDMW